MATYYVVFYNNKVFLAYLKDTKEAKYTDNLSPLHWENARAIPVDSAQLKQLELFTQDFLKKWPMKYAGLDIIEDLNGKLWLIEVNSSPGFSYYVKDNGEQAVIEMLKVILSDLQAQYSRIS